MKKLALILTFISLNLHADEGFEKAAIKAFHESGIAKTEVAPCPNPIKLEEPKAVLLEGGGCMVPMIMKAMVVQTFHCGFSSRSLVVTLDVEMDFDTEQVDEEGYVLSVYTGKPESVKLATISQ